MKSRLFISVLLGVLPLLYRHASAQAIEVTSTGNVGIGTMTPDSKLHVSGGHLNIDNSYAIAWGGGTGRPAIFGDKISGALSFYTNGWETVRVTNTGNVGIGTSNPAAKLTVVGDVYSASASTVGAGTNFSTITASSTSSSLYLVRSVGTWSDTWWQWTHDTGNKLKLGFSSVPQAEFSNGLAVFLGNVGIGTTSPFRSRRELRWRCELVCRLCF